MFVIFFHSLDHKIGTIYNLVDRVILLSHLVFQENFELFIKLLLENDYPLKLIFREVVFRLKKNYLVVKFSNKF